MRLLPATSPSSVFFQSTVSLASRLTLCYATALFEASTTSACSTVCSLSQNSHARKPCSWHKRLSPLNRMCTICTSLLLESCMSFAGETSPGASQDSTAVSPALHLSLLGQFIIYRLLPPAPVVQKATRPGIASFAPQCATNAVKQDTFAMPVAQRATTSNVHGNHTSFYRTPTVYLCRKVIITITMLMMFSSSQADVWIH